MPKTRCVFARLFVRLKKSRVSPDTQGSALSLRYESPAIHGEAPLVPRYLMRVNGIYSSAADVGKTMTAMNLTRDCCEHSVSAQVSRSIIHRAKTLHTAQSHARPLSRRASCPASHFGTAHNSKSRLRAGLKKRFARSSRKPSRKDATTRYHSNAVRD